MRYRTLRGFLMAFPRPVSVRVRSGANQQTITREPTQSWRQFADTIDAMDPEAIEVLGAQGEVLRASRIESFEEYGTTEEDEPAPAAAASDRTIAATLDAETARFNTFADHIARAYQFGYETAFTKLVQIADIMGKRGESLERALASTERLLRQQIEENLETKVELAEQQLQIKDPLSEMVTSFVAGQQQGATAAPSNGKAKS